MAFGMSRTRRGAAGDKAGGTGGTGGTIGIACSHGSHRSHRSHRSHLFPPRPALACVALCLAACAALAAGEAPPPTLCIEYVPGIVYEDEPITVCVRVEAGSAPLAVRLTVALNDAAGHALASEAAEGTPAPSAPWRHQSTLAAGNGAPASLTLSLAPASRGTPLATLSLGVLNGRAALPPLELRGTSLADAQGRHAVIRIEHRIRVPEQRWPLVRWVRRQVYGTGWEFRHVLVLGDDLGAPRDGYLAQLASASGAWTTTVLPVPAAEREAGPPVLRAVAALTAAPAAAPDLAVLCLGSRDPDLGTDVLLFGRALELILQQLEARGCRQFVLASPVGPSRSRARLAPYREAVERVAFTYQARHLDLGGQLPGAAWLADPKDDRLVLRLPNAAGQRALAEAIRACLAQLRR